MKKHWKSDELLWRKAKSPDPKVAGATGHLLSTDGVYYLDIILRRRGTYSPLYSDQNELENS